MPSRVEVFSVKEKKIVFPSVFPATIMYSANDITLRCLVMPLRKKYKNPEEEHGHQDWDQWFW